LARGTGILNNELYVGRLIWNRRSVHQDAYRASARPRPPSVVTQEAPALRISTARSGTREGTPAARAPWSSPMTMPAFAPDGRAEPVYLCRTNQVRRLPARFSKVSNEHYGCSAGKIAHLATPHHHPPRQIEASVLSGLQDHLMQPELVTSSSSEYRGELTGSVPVAKVLMPAEGRAHARDKQIHAIIEAVQGRHADCRQEGRAHRARSAQGATRQ